MALTLEQLAAFQRGPAADGSWGAGDMGYGQWNSSGGISPELLAAMGLDPNETYYTAGNGGERGTGKIGDQYQVLDSKGGDTGIRNEYSKKGVDPALMALMAAAAMYGGAAFMGGGINPVMAGGSSLGGGAGAAGAAGGAAGAAGPWGGFGVAGDAYLPGAMSIGGSVGSAAPLAGLEGYLATGGAAAAGGAGGASAGGGGAAGGAASGASGLGSAAPASATGGIGSMLKGAASGLLSNGSWLAPLIGGALGSQPTTTENNVTKKMDPRMDALVYGDGGLLNNATDWYSQNKSGMNDAMRGAIAQNRSLLNDPTTRQGFQNMSTQGQGLLNRQVASNPFTSAQRPQFGSNLLQQYLHGGLLGQ